MEIRPYTDADIALTEALECDPVVMTELGGAMPKDHIPRVHAKRLRLVAEGTCWWFVIVPDPATGPVGTVGMWAGDHRGESIFEMGWMVLPAHQGKGHASAAVRLCLERAREQGRFSPLHAFPGVTNGPSNGICRKAGFRKLEECDIDYAGRPLRCNHWRIELDRPILSP